MSRRKPESIAARNSLGIEAELLGGRVCRLWVCPAAAGLAPFPRAVVVAAVPPGAVVAG
jgi:hypothetical protein